MLSDASIRRARPRQKPYKLADSGGLYLLVNPTGARWWRLKYRLHGREKGISLGVYPAVSLALARKRRDDAKEQLAKGIDPSASRKAAKSAHGDTFEAIGREWLALQHKKLAPATYAKRVWTLEKLVWPWLGQKPIGTITPPELLACLRRIESRGKHETAHRTKNCCGQVFRYAIATGRAERDISADLSGALAPYLTKHHAGLTEPKRIGEMLRAIDGYSGQFSTAVALKLSPMLFARPGELRAAVWAEFDLDNAEWRIPAHRMKMGEEHLIPLAHQALSLLRELQPLTGDGKYLFPSLRTAAKPIAENTINAALRRLGYAKDEMTAHGFRTMASTLLNEQGFAPDVIELQLAHAERNKVRAAYNRAQRIAERRKMMQAWADYLDGLKAGGKVVPIKHKARGN